MAPNIFFREILFQFSKHTTGKRLNRHLLTTDKKNTFYGSILDISLIFSNPGGKFTLFRKTCDTKGFESKILKHDNLNLELKRCPTKGGPPGTLMPKKNNDHNRLFLTASKSDRYFADTL